MSAERDAIDDARLRPMTEGHYAGIAMTSDRLNACGHCGSFDLWVLPDAHDIEYSVLCRHCGARGPHGHDADEAVRKWGLRS